VTDETVTRAACLTPTGSAALATLAIRGPSAWQVATELFRPRSNAVLPSEPVAGWFRLGRFGDEAADEVVLSVRRAGSVPWVEVHCHGGREVVRSLLEALARRGVQIGTWKELERADGRLPSALAAWEALGSAPTVRTAGILLDQFHGAFDQSLDTIRTALEAGQTSEAKSLLDRLVALVPVGRHLVRPWRVVLAGAPNVGKSSLANALAGYQRSIVAATPGTTRDTVSTVLAIDGWPVELVDTAGIRDEAVDLESAGIGRAQEAIASADLCLWLVDGAGPPIWPKSLGPNVRTVINKVDLPAAWDHGGVEAVGVSAQSGIGIAELCKQLATWLVPMAPNLGEAVPFTPEWCDRIEAAQRAVVENRHDDAFHHLEDHAPSRFGATAGDGS
jgi:tRNA modification GTPase